MRLLQHRLDVTDKTRSNLFNWRAQFTPQFVDYVLANFAKTGDVVIDPFAGSGTVLQECSAKHMSCHGFEINPAAYAMSKFFTIANCSEVERIQILSPLEEKLRRLTDPFQDLPLFKQSGDFRESHKNLLDFTELLFSEISDKRERVLALNTLFVAESRQKNSLAETILSSFDYIKQSTLGLPFTECEITAHLADARMTHTLYPLKADLIFTSPPYINVFNYHQNHRAILEKLGWNLLKVATSEFGSNRKNRANRFKTVTQYCLDMSKAIESFWHTLKPNGLLVIVIGRESNIRRVAFHNTLIVKDLLRFSDGFSSLTNYERTFVNRYGVKIKEDIIVTKKSISIPTHLRARKVANKHLNSAIHRSPVSVQSEIKEALESIESIEESPLFSADGVLQSV
jgi:DNA modification methylase